jgi:endonuclease/exonuclease/phosphatase family metal-dependent hydrolase
MLSICTCNVNNLFVRYKFGSIFPGDMSGKSKTDETGYGYLPLYQTGAFDLFRPEQRQLTAQALTQDFTKYPDVLCLQEVESLIALRRFNEEHLKKHYPHALLLDSRDFRQIDVAVLSTKPIRDVRTHIDELDPEPPKKEWPWMFSRDCLEVEVECPDAPNGVLILLVNHLKSKMAETATEAKQAEKQRTHQAKAVMAHLHDRFGNDFENAWFAVVGDFNDGPDSKCLAALVDNAQSSLTNVLDRLPAATERWTHYYRGESTVTQFDYILLSPKLNADTGKKRPIIERRGIGFERVLKDGSPGPRKVHFERRDDDPNRTDIDFQFPRFKGVTPSLYASDHCPVTFEI